MIQENMSSKAFELQNIRYTNPGADFSEKLVVHKCQLANQLQSLLLGMLDQECIHRPHNRQILLLALFGNINSLGLPCRNALDIEQSVGHHDGAVPHVHHQEYLNRYEPDYCQVSNTTKEEQPVEPKRSRS